MFEKNKIAIPYHHLGVIHRIMHSIREDLPRCEIWLEFTFDYNMEYTDAFNPQVRSVDIFVFDSDDKLLFSKRAEASALIGGNRMPLADNL